MNSQENQNWEQKLQELEAEVNQTTPMPPVNESKPPTTTENTALKESLSQVKTWFDSLPSIGKVAVAVVAAIIGFSLLRTVLQLVTSLLTIAILGVFLYLLYKFFVAPKSSQ